METAIHVFIYGSLLPGEHNHHVAERSILHSQPGRVAGRLVDVGFYPALVRDRTALQGAITTRGLWITVPLNALASLDMLEQFYGWEEENDYDRIWVQDLDNQDVGGWVYVWDTDRGCPSVEDSYWPDYYASKQNRNQS